MPLARMQGMKPTEAKSVMLTTLYNKLANDNKIIELCS